MAWLFQTGYLTVDKISYDQNGRDVYSLKIPNKEVRNFSNHTFSGRPAILYKKDEASYNKVLYGYFNMLANLVPAEAPRFRRDTGFGCHFL
ncbi:MAG: hypothetical protein LBP22_11015 [Deltaproteobacteria bacterium]|nr:hypothetical protein [Deltaproteobacteria bacterium]